MNARHLRLKLPGMPAVNQNEGAKNLLAFHLRTQPTVPVFHLEYHFALELARQHRFDLAWPERKLAVEVNGGIWINGAHAHPTAILRNMEKLNLACLLGWRHLSFTPDQVRTGEALAFILKTLETPP